MTIGPKGRVHGICSLHFRHPQEVAIPNNQKSLEFLATLMATLAMVSTAKMPPNNLLKRTGTLKVGKASKVLFRSVALRKRMPARLTGR